MLQLVRLISLALIVSVGLLFAGCSRSPSDAELAQLEQLKSQVRDLEGKVSAAQRDKSNLEKTLAEKNGRLQQCQADQEAVKKAMGGQ